MQISSRPGVGLVDGLLGVFFVRTFLYRQYFSKRVFLLSLYEISTCSVNVEITVVIFCCINCVIIISMLGTVEMC